VKLTALLSPSPSTRYPQDSFLVPIRPAHLFVLSMFRARKNGQFIHFERVELRNRLTI
jgi:hypothetical protein